MKRLVQPQQNTTKQQTCFLVTAIRSTQSTRFQTGLLGCAELPGTTASPDSVQHSQAWKTLMKRWSTGYRRIVTQAVQLCHALSKQEMTRSRSNMSDAWWVSICEHIDTHDGFSKVLFPISAKNRIPCVTPLVLLVKKSYTEDTSKMQ